jgi:uncharacterized protein YcaQ
VREARALLSPVDPLVWSRPRTGRIFGFRHRIELYTPAAEPRLLAGRLELDHVSVARKG